MILPKVSQNILGHDIAKIIPKYPKPWQVHLSSPWWVSEYLLIGGTIRSKKLIFNPYKNMVGATKKGRKIEKIKNWLLIFLT